MEIFSSIKQTLSNLFGSSQSQNKNHATVTAAGHTFTPSPQDSTSLKIEEFCPRFHFEEDSDSESHVDHVVFHNELEVQVDVEQIGSPSRKFLCISPRKAEMRAFPELFHTEDSHHSSEFENSVSNSNVEQEYVIIASTTEKMDSQTHSDELSIVGRNSVYSESFNDDDFLSLPGSMANSIANSTVTSREPSVNGQYKSAYEDALYVNDDSLIQEASLVEKSVSLQVKKKVKPLVKKSVDPLVEKSVNLPSWEAPFNEELYYKRFSPQQWRDLSILNAQILRFSLDELAPKYDISQTDVEQIRQNISQILFKNVKKTFKEKYKQVLTETATKNFQRLQREFFPEFTGRNLSYLERKKVKQKDPSFKEKVFEEAKTLMRERNLHKILFFDKIAAKKTSSAFEDITSDISHYLKSFLHKNPQSEKFIHDFNDHVKAVCVNKKSPVYREKIEIFNDFYAVFEELSKEAPRVEGYYKQFNDFEASEELRKEADEKISKFNQKASNLKKEINNLSPDDRAVFNSLNEDIQITEKGIDDKFLSFQKAQKENKLKIKNAQLIQMDKILKQSLEGNCQLEGKLSSQVQVISKFFNEYDSKVHVDHEKRKKFKNEFKSGIKGFFLAKTNSDMNAQMSEIASFWNISIDT
jgi:hypothetical protein